MIPALFRVGFAALIVATVARVVDRPLALVRPAPEAFLMGNVLGESVTWLRVGGTALTIGGIAPVSSGPALRRLAGRRSDALPTGTA